MQYNTDTNTQKNTASQQLIILYKQFDASQVIVTKPEATERSMGQLNGYINYEQSRKQLVMQCPWIKHTNYGLPRLDGKYYKDDKDRLNLKIPLVRSDKRVGKFIGKLESLDEICNSNDFRKEKFGANAKKYKDDYQFIVRQPGELSEEALANNPDLANKERPEFMKVKLATAYPTGEITTIVELDHQDGMKPERVGVATLDQFEQYFRYGCEYKPIIRAVKFWAQSTSGNKHPMYGITWKLEKIIIRPVQSSISMSEVLNDMSYIDDSDDEDMSNLQPRTKSTKVDVVDDVDDEASVDSDVEEEVKESEPKQAAKKVVEEDSDDSDEEEPEPVVKKSKKVKKQVVESDSDDSDEEEPQPKKKETKTKKLTKKTKKAKKVVESDSDDDSDDDSD